MTIQTKSKFMLKNLIRFKINYTNIILVQKKHTVLKFILPFKSSYFKYFL